MQKFNQLKRLKTPVAAADVSSKFVVMLLFIHLDCCSVVCGKFVFSSCFVILIINSSFAIVSLRKRELVAML